MDPLFGARHPASETRLPLDHEGLLRTPDPGAAALPVGPDPSLRLHGGAATASRGHHQLPEGQPDAGGQPAELRSCPG